MLVILFKAARKAEAEASGRIKCTRCYRNVIPRKDAHGKSHCPSCGAFMCTKKLRK